MASKPAPKKEAAPAAKSKKPHFPGINHPRNLHKAFRGSGNKLLIRSTLERQRTKLGPATSSSK